MRARQQLIAVALLAIATPLYADPGASYYAEAKPPLAPDALQALTRQLEALSAKQQWAQAKQLATAQLGESWCRDALALDFRTFAALGVIARRLNEQDLAVACTMRSFFAAETSVSLGMSLFELSLLVKDMDVDAFTRFRASLYALPKTACNDKDACCHEVNEFSIILRSLDPEYYGPLPRLDDEERVPTDPAKIEAQRQRMVTDLTRAAYTRNPSPALAKRLRTASQADKARLIEATLATLPKQLVPVHHASSSERAKAWILKHVKHKVDTRWETRAPHKKLQVTQAIIGVSDGAGDCAMWRKHYVILHVQGSDKHVIYEDPHRYSDNACGGYGDTFTIEPPRLLHTCGERSADRDRHGAQLLYQWDFVWCLRQRFEAAALLHHRL